MKGPWRSVTHIEIREGPRGGRYFDLDLECKHVAFVTMKRCLGLLGLRKGQPLVQTAPYRVQCWHCGLLAKKQAPFA